MGWETRANGQYYYRKVRRGGRVVSEYVGAGELAESWAEQDELIRLEREAEREQWNEVVQKELDLDKNLDQIGNLLRTLTTTVLLANGCYCHKRQWRRRGTKGYRSVNGEESINE